jgi:hypothetical protein
MRQSVKHLWVDHFTADTPRPHYISHLHGRDQLRRDAHEAVAEAERKARLWWKSVATPEGVVVEARRQAMNEYDIHWPKARLVAAFTLARLGDLSAARQELQVILDSMRDGNPEEADRLAILLEETSPHPMQ